MKLLLSALMLCTTAVQAAELPRLTPTEKNEAPTCFKREYSAEHLRRNPQQLLEQMYVKVSKQTGQNESDTWTWMPAEVVGVNRGDYYGNTAGCQISPKGVVLCQIECDGGSFNLRNSTKVKNAVDFVVSKDYYFPLFKNHMSMDDNQETETPASPHISLQGPANSVYRLVPADVSECQQAIDRTLGQGLGGC